MQQGHVFMSSTLEGRISDSELFVGDDHDSVLIKSKLLKQSFTSSFKQFSLSSTGLLNITGSDHGSLPQWLFNCLGEVVEVLIFMQKSKVSRKVKVLDIQVDAVESTWSVLGEVFITGVKNETV
jgi:hypothetical protein